MHRLPLVDEGESDRVPDPQPSALRDKGDLATAWGTEVSASELQGGPSCQHKSPFIFLSF